MAKDKAPERADIPVAHANIVAKFTTMNVLRDVRSAFCALPAHAFAEWLTREMEKAERMP